MEKSNRSLALGGLIAAFCLGACITTSDELDLNKEISLDMQIGPGGLYIPLGSLDTLYLDSLIKLDGDNSVLDTLDGGLFGFTMRSPPVPRSWQPVLQQAPVSPPLQRTEAAPRPPAPTREEAEPHQRRPSRQSSR